MNPLLACSEGMGWPDAVFGGLTMLAFFGFMSALIWGVKR